MVGGTQFKMNLFSEVNIPDRLRADAGSGMLISRAEGTAAHSGSVSFPAVDRLTVTPDTDYTALTESQKALWVRAQGGCSAISGMARVLYGADNAEGVDLNPEPGKIRVQTVQGEEFIEEDMAIKNPENKSFELKNIESFHLKARNAFTGGFTTMSLQSDVELDIDGDGKKEKGTLCKLQEGVQDQYTHRTCIVSDMQAFINNNAQSITLIEKAANPIRRLCTAPRHQQGFWRLHLPRADSLC